LNENDTVEPGKDTKLSGGSINVNVTKAVPVTINDNGQLKFGKSAYKNIDEILNQLNIKVYPEDVVTSDLIISDFTENGLGRKITIKRSPAIVLEADGVVTQIRTNKSTVGEVLAERGIVLGPKDEVTPSVNMNIVTGTTITVVRVTEADITEDESIPFAVVTNQDSNMYQGQSRLEVEGLNGAKKKTSHVVYRNGVLASKTVLSETLLQAPRNKVVVSGTKPYGGGDLWGIMVAAGSEWGVSPDKLYRVAKCESGANPSNNRNPVYKGLYQYLPSTWSGASGSYPGGRFRGASIFDPTAQVYVTAWKVSKQGWGAWPSCGYR
jgi:uncharacterized protein YabE (DUF348 family)